MPTSDRVFAFSDTHIGATYANSSPNQEALLREGICNADIVVISGDAFEFTQSFATPEARLKRAIETFARWQDYNPKAEFHFVVGNHEAPRNYAPNQKYLAEIRALWPELRDALQEKGVHTHEEYCRIGDTVFAHGHIDTCKKNEQLPGMVSKGTFHHVGNVVAPGTKLAERHFPMERVLPAIHRLVKLCVDRDAMPREGETSTPPAPINHIVFGHTHYSFFDKQFPDMPGLSLGNDIHHYNLGCSVLHRPDQFQPLSFMLDGDTQTGKTHDFQLAKMAMRQKEGTLWQSFAQRAQSFVGIG